MSDNYTRAFEMTEQEYKDELKDQDEIVEDMLTTIKRLNVHADDINVHIEEDNKILDELYNDMEIQENRIQKGILKLDKLLNTKSKKYAIIIILLIVLFVLMYFMFN
mmetsp:Transcript_49358/g.44173  ORF Transcript_49358/g.44173 Transcript_49358/m.44173 type:complete len:107 (-) Transcript_49358:129-449(-)